MRMMLVSFVSGMTASETPEDQVPRIARTLLTSMSFFAASTPACGLVCESSARISSLRPAAPPAAFTASAAAMIAFCIPGPYGLPDPVTGQSAPMRNVSCPCARRMEGAPISAVAAPSVPMNWRRVVIILFSPLAL